MKKFFHCFLASIFIFFGTLPAMQNPYGLPGVPGYPYAFLPEGPQQQAAIYGVYPSQQGAIGVLLSAPNPFCYLTQEQLPQALFLQQFGLVGNPAQIVDRGPRQSQLVRDGYTGVVYPCKRNQNAQQVAHQELTIHPILAGSYFARPSYQAMPLTPPTSPENELRQPTAVNPTIRAIRAAAQRRGKPPLPATIFTPPRAVSEQVPASIIPSAQTTPPATPRAIPASQPVASPASEEVIPPATTDATVPEQQSEQQFVPIAQPVEAFPLRTQSALLAWIPEPAGHEQRHVTTALRTQSAPPALQIELTTSAAPIVQTHISPAPASQIGSQEKDTHPETLVPAQALPQELNTQPGAPTIAPAPIEENKKPAVVIKKKSKPSSAATVTNATQQVEQTTSQQEAHKEEVVVTIGEMREISEELSCANLKKRPPNKGKTLQQRVVQSTAQRVENQEEQPELKEETSEQKEAEKRAAQLTAASQKVLKSKRYQQKLQEAQLVALTFGSNVAGTHQETNNLNSNPQTTRRKKTNKKKNSGGHQNTAAKEQDRRDQEALAQAAEYNQQHQKQELQKPKHQASTTPLNPEKNPKQQLENFYDQILAMGIKQEPAQLTKNAAIQEIDVRLEAYKALAQQPDTTWQQWADLYQQAEQSFYTCLPLSNNAHKSLGTLLPNILEQMKSKLVPSPTNLWQVVKALFTTPDPDGMKQYCDLLLRCSLLMYVHIVPKQPDRQSSDALCERIIDLRTNIDAANLNTMISIWNAYLLLDGLKDFNRSSGQQEQDIATFFAETAQQSDLHHYAPLFKLMACMRELEKGDLPATQTCIEALIKETSLYDPKQPTIIPHHQTFCRIMERIKKLATARSQGLALPTLWAFALCGNDLESYHKALELTAQKKRQKESCDDLAFLNNELSKKRCLALLMKDRSLCSAHKKDDTFADHVRLAQNFVTCFESTRPAQEKALT